MRAPPMPAAGGSSKSSRHQHRSARRSLHTVPEDLLSRVGVAKYHLFNEGIKFGRRPKRKEDRRVSQVDMPAAGGESPS